MNAENPLVSIVIPTYNRADTIKKCLDSVLGQTYKNIEVIVVDDGSTDNTEEVVKRFGDPRIRYISYRTNKGANHARNTGIKRAEGDLIALQDSDDEWHPKKIEKQVEAYLSSTEEYKVIYSSLKSERSGGEFYMPEDWVHPTEGDVRIPTLRGTFVSTATIMVEKGCFEEIGYFDEELPRLQDWDIGIRLSKKYKFKHVDEPLVMHRVSEDSISSNFNSLAQALEIMLEKHRQEFIQDKSVYSSHYFWLASAYVSLNKWDEGIENMKKGYRIKPHHPITICRLLASLLGAAFYKQFRGLYRKILL